MGIVVFYLVLALIPAIVAGRKGRSAAGFFLFAVFLTPILALIVALIIDPGRDHAPSQKKLGLKAPAGTQCGKCDKPLSPAWVDTCKHCGASYMDFTPVVAVAP